MQNHSYKRQSSDFLAQGRRIPEVRDGELLAVMSAGAYGMVMASNYNSRPRPAEVMVRGSQVSLVRRRESIKELVDQEIVAPWLK